MSGGVGVAVVAVNAKTGTLVYDHFHDGPQRMELDTRLRQLAVSSHGFFGHARVRHMPGLCIYLSRLGSYV